jgi:hypothetical protein
MNTRESIESAFAEVPYPGDDNIADHQNCLECEELRTYLRGKTWKELSFPKLHDFHEALPLLTPEAFRFFLPGYMLAALTNWDESGMIPYSIVQIGGYHDDAWNVRDEARENRKIFSPRQREAIGSWLKDLIRYGPMEWRDNEGVQYSIERIVND